jgi:hypothetical protein
MRALDEIAPAAICEFFQQAGLRATEQRVGSPAGPRWAVWLHARNADLWVEAADRVAAWRKAAAYAREAGLVPDLLPLRTSFLEPTA